MHVCSLRLLPNLCQRTPTTLGIRVWLATSTWRPMLHTVIVMTCVKHIQTVWKTEYCSPTADPTLSQPDSINIHKLVWPSLVEAALSFSSECTVCVYMRVTHGLRPGKAYILDTDCRICKQQSPSLLLCSLETSRKT